MMLRVFGESFRTLVVHVKGNWGVGLKTKLGENVENPQALLAQVQEGFVFGLRAGQGDGSLFLGFPRDCSIPKAVGVG
jgi:hypothetical protein